MVSPDRGPREDAPCETCGRTDVLVVPSPHMGVRQCNGCFAAALVKPSREEWQRPVAVGDPVLYHQLDGSVLGVITAVAEHDGDADIDLGAPSGHALDVKQGQGIHTYETLDAPAGWSIVHCPNDGHRWPSFMATCPRCGEVLPDA